MKDVSIVRELKTEAELMTEIKTITRHHIDELLGSPSLSGVIIMAETEDSLSIKLIGEQGAIGRIIKTHELSKTTRRWDRFALGVWLVLTCFA